MLLTQHSGLSYLFVAWSLGLAFWFCLLFFLVLFSSTIWICSGFCLFLGFLLPVGWPCSSAPLSFSLPISFWSYSATEYCQYWVLRRSPELAGRTPCHMCVCRHDPLPTAVYIKLKVIYYLTILLLWYRGYVYKKTALNIWSCDIAKMQIQFHMQEGVFQDFLNLAVAFQ